MSDNEHRKRGFDDSDSPDTDSDDRRHKRIAVLDELFESKEKPRHHRRDKDVKMEVDRREDDEVAWMAIRALVSMKEAGVIIGKLGKNVDEIREQSGAKLTISEIIPGAIVRVMTISGPLDIVANAYALVARKIIVEQREQGEQRNGTWPETESIGIQVLVPHHLMGAVIGKSGTKIREIQEVSAAHLQASDETLPGSMDRTVTITGVPDSIHIALYHIGALLQENDRENRFTSIQYRPVPHNSCPRPRGYPLLGPPPPSTHYRHHPHHQGYYGGGGEGYMHGAYGLDYMPTSVGGALAQEILIPNDVVGTVIGKNGANINEIRHLSGSHIKIADVPGARNERLVTITGTLESNQMAVYLLNLRLEGQKADHSGKRG